MYTRSKGCELRNKTVGMCFLPPQLPGCVTWNKLHNFPGLQVVHLKQGIMVVLAYWYDVKIAQLCPTLCNPMDYTVHGILWSRILEWVAFPFSRGSFQPRDWTQVSTLQVDSLPPGSRGKPLPHPTPPPAVILTEVADNLMKVTASHEEQTSPRRILVFF